MLVNTRFIQPEELIITDPLEKRKKNEGEGSKCTWTWRARLEGMKPPIFFYTYM